MKRDERTMRRRRIRARVSGTAERPRASVYRSRTRLHVQLIDDTAGHTLAAIRGDGQSGHSVATTEALGRALAEAATKQGITAVVFDRGGFRYQGRIKALAEGLRAGGLTL